MTRQEQLAGVVAALKAARTRLHELANRTPDERWSVRSDPARWSVAECIAHLNLTSHAFLAIIDPALDEVQRMGRASRPAYRQSALGWLLSGVVGPMKQIGSFQIGRAKTPARFVPGGELPKAAIVDAFDRDHVALAERAAASEPWPIDRVRIVSPFDARVRYSVYDAFVMIPLHDQRHLIQAEGVWQAR